MALNTKYWLYLGLAVVAGIATGLYIGEDADGPAAAAAVNDEARPGAAAGSGAPAVDPATSAQIERLQATLQAEVQARRLLEQKLAALQRKVAALDDTQAVYTPAEETVEAAQLPGAAGGAQTGWFNQQALIDSGMDSATASELKDFFEQLEMERLFLRDRAAREGWDRAQLRNEFSLLDTREEELRQRLGEDGYDAYLYASGQPNRVAVTSVLESAQAGQAGIRAGDHILRYDDQRVYDWRDLRQATTSGDLSDTVTVEVERDGESLQFYLARGPLGIRMNPVSVAPQ